MSRKNCDNVIFLFPFLHSYTVFFILGKTTTFKPFPRYSVNSILANLDKHWLDKWIQNIRWKDGYKILDGYKQGYNARRVISEEYASFVLQCIVSGR